MLSESRDQRIWPLLVYAALGLGILIRLYMFFMQRDLWIDECMLVLGAIWQSLPMVDDLLPYAQQAGVGYMWLLRGMYLLFGPTEMSFRAISVISSIGTLFLLAWLLRRFSVRRGVSALIMFMAAVNPILLRYANDAKQYSLDGLLSISMIAILQTRLKENKWFMLPMLVLGVFISHPFLFVAGAFCIAYAVEKKKVFDPTILLYASVIVASFVVNYFVFLNKGLHIVHGVTFIHDYFALGMAPVEFWKLSTWYWYVKKVSDIFVTMFGFRWMIFGVLFTGFGVALLWERRKLSLLIMLASPFLFALVASSLHVYTTRLRLILFVVPSLLLLLAFGLDYLVDALKKRFAVYALVGSFVFVAALYPAYTMAKRFADYGDMGEKEEIGKALQYMNDHRREGENLHIAFNIYPNVCYYRVRSELEFDSPVRPYIFPPDPADARAFAQQVSKDVGDRGWAVISHHRIHGEAVMDELRAMGYTITGYTSVPGGSAGAYLLIRESE